MVFKIGDMVFKIGDKIKLKRPLFYEDEFMSHMGSSFELNGIFRIQDIRYDKQFQCYGIEHCQSKIFYDVAKIDPLTFELKKDYQLCECEIESMLKPKIEKMLKI